MRRLCALALVGVALFGSTALAAPSISYPTFLFNGPFQLNGNSLGVHFSTLLLTDDGNQTSSTFVIAPQDLTQSFTSTYSFYIGAGSGLATTTGTGPGAIALVIQGDIRGPSAIGAGGTQLAYGDGVAHGGNAIQHSLALVYSTYGGVNQFKLLDNAANANFDATSTPLATQTGSENLSGLLSQVTLNYESPDGTYPNGAVSVLLNGNPIGLSNVALPASLASLAGASNGYFGFSATTLGTTGTGPYLYINSFTAGAVPEPASVFLFAVPMLLLRRGRR